MTVVRYLIVALLIGAMWQSCKHHPLIQPLEPGDTTGTPIDTTDTTVVTPPAIDSTGQPCDPNKVYFVNDVVVFVNTYCTTAGQDIDGEGCHVSGENDIVFTGSTLAQMYNNIVNEGDVDPFDANGSKFYEVMLETDPDKHMPPTGLGLDQPTAEDIAMIKQWIDEGAKFDSCNANYGQPLGCDTTDITFADIQPIINNNCKSCHNATVTMDGIDLSSHQGVINAQNDNQRLQGSVNHWSGYTAMPFNKPKLSDCDIKKINAWIAEGMN